MPASVAEQNRSNDAFVAANAQLEVALLTAAPANSSVTWAALTRVNYTGYTDVQVANTIFDASAAGEAPNNTLVQFAVNAGAESATITHAAVRTGTTGDVYRWEAVVAPGTVKAGNRAELPIGNLRIKAT